MNEEEEKKRQEKSLLFAYIYGKELTISELDTLLNSERSQMLKDARELYDPPVDTPIIIETQTCQ